MDVVVVTEDGHTVPVPLEVLPLITLVHKTALLSREAAGPAQVMLPKIRGCTFSKVLEWAHLHKDDPVALATVDPTRRAAAPNKEQHARQKIKLSLPALGGPADGDDDDEDPSPDADSDGSDAGYVDEFGHSAINADIHICPADRKLLDTLTIPSLIDLTAAANYLAMEPLLDVCCKSIAGHMTGLSVEELRLKFNIPNDFTPEEEARMKTEFGWADE